MKGLVLLCLAAQFAVLAASSPAPVMEEATASVDQALTAAQPAIATASSSVALPESTSALANITPSQVEGVLSQTLASTPQPESTVTQTVAATSPLNSESPAPAQTGPAQRATPARSESASFSSMVESPTPLSQVQPSSEMVPVPSAESTANAPASAVPTESNTPVAPVETQTGQAESTEPPVASTVPVESISSATPMATQSEAIETGTMSAAPTQSVISVPQSSSCPFVAPQTSNPSPSGQTCPPLKAQLPQCTANDVQGFKITSPVNFFGSPSDFIQGNYQLIDPDSTTIFLPPQGQPQPTSGTTSAVPNPVPVTYTNDTAVSLTGIRPGFQTVSWSLTMADTQDMYQQPQMFAVPQGTNSQNQEQSRMQGPQSIALISTPQGYCLPTSAFTGGSSSQQSGEQQQQQQQQQNTNTVSSNQPIFPSMQSPSRIFNPSSIKLIDTQGQTVPGIYQVSWYQEQSKNGGALLAYIGEDVADGVYSFLLTGQFQRLMPVPGLQFTPFSTIFYQPGPDCAFLTHPFRLVSTPQVQLPPPVPLAPQPQTQTVTQSVIAPTPQTVTQSVYQPQTQVVAQPAVQTPPTQQAQTPAQGSGPASPQQSQSQSQSQSQAHLANGVPI